MTSRRRFGAGWVGGPNPRGMGNPGQSGWPGTVSGEVPVTERTDDNPAADARALRRAAAIPRAMDAVSGLIARVFRRPVPAKDAGRAAPPTTNDGLDAILDSMAEGVVVIDTGGRVRRINPEARRIFGATAAEIPIAAWPERLGIYRHDGRTPYPAAELPLARASAGHGTDEIELFVRNDQVPDGAWLAAGAQPWRDGAGHVRGGLMVFREVTTRKRAEAALHDERLRHQRQQRRHDAIAEIELSLAETSGLRSLLDRVSEIAREQLPAAASCVTLWDPETASLLDDEGAPAASDAHIMRDHAGANRWILEHRRPVTVADVDDDPFGPHPLPDSFGLRSYTGVPIFDGGEVIGVLFALHTEPRLPAQEDLDFLAALAARAAIAITKVRLYDRLRALNASLARHRQELETTVQERTAELEDSHRQLRNADRLAAIGTLTAGLGHDMNNVLFPVRCRLEALDWDSVPGDLVDVLEAVSHAVDYLQQLTDDLRQVALDPDHGRPADRGERYTDLRTWWPKVSPLLTKSLPDPVTFEVDLGEDDLPPLRVAPHRLTQAVLNLVMNAGEAVADGGHVRLWADLCPDGAYVDIGVADDGPGMTDEVRRQAFDPFFTTKKRRLSTGLGLSLVHSTVVAVGGSIEVDSTPGRGTRVVLSLPAATDASATTASANGGRAVRGTAAITVTDARVAAWMSGLLRSAGYEVERSDDGPGDEAALWLTEAATASLDHARRFLDDDDGRRVLVFGPAPDAWREIGACVIEPEHDLDAVRALVREDRTRPGSSQGADT